MRPLERNQIDDLVRQLESSAYGLALELTHDTEEAAEALLRAFGQTAPSFPRLRTVDSLKRKLAVAIKREADRHESSVLEGHAAPSVPDQLHIRLVDVVEERQNDEPIGPSRVVVTVVGALIVLGVLGGYAFVRWSALNAARPVVDATDPAPGAVEVSLQGGFWVRFTRPPAVPPSITLQPADGALSSASWDGHTVLVSYSGLHLATRYTLRVAADYRSRYRDTGHFAQEWHFTTEGYPVVVSLNPRDGATGAARNGQISIDFNHRPPDTPTVTITPADAVSFQVGQWNGTTWTMSYAGLKPLTTYQATVVVDYGVPKANIHRAWSFVTEPGAPPAGTPVVWYSTSEPIGPAGQVTMQRLLAIDWSGALIGTMYQSGVRGQSPDGSVLLDEDGSFLDRTGAPITGPAAANYPTFADDNHSVCALLNAGAGSTVSLYAGAFGGPLRPVALVGQLSAQSGFGLAGCSVLNDRAVIVASGVQATAVRVLRLSNGATIYQRSYGQGSSTVFITCSHDGLFLAEETQATDANTGLTSAVTLIRRATDGVVVAQLENQRVVAFSSDDARVVTAPAETAFYRNEVDLVDWQTGTMLWRLPGAPGTDGTQAVYAIGQPSGTSVMVAVGTSPGISAGQLWLVDKGGAARELVSSPLYAPFFGRP